MAGSPTAKIHDIFAARAAEIGYAGWQYRDSPVQLWDLFGEQGHPIRTTVTRNGPAAARPADEPQRGPGRRAEHRLPRRRQGRAAARSTSTICRRCWSTVGERADELTLEYGNVVEAVGRRDPALAAPAAQPGRRPFLRRAGARARRFPRPRRQRPRRRQHPRRRPADGQPAALFDLPAVAAVRAVRAASRGRRPAASPSCASSSTRRICCSTTPRRRCSRRSSRSCA